MVVGEIAGPGTLGVLSVSEQAKILTLHTAAPIETISKEYGRRYAFRGYIAYQEMFPGILKWLAENRKVKRLTTLDLDYERGHFGHDLLRKLCPQFGIEIVYDDYFPAGAKDMGPFILKALAKNPDVFFNTASSGAYWGLIIKQARDLGYQKLFSESHPPTPK
jgi:branched-chain amino acid transport system substrate-binding protein